MCVLYSRESLKIFIALIFNYWVVGIVLCCVALSCAFADLLLGGRSRIFGGESIWVWMFWIHYVHRYIAHDNTWSKYLSILPQPHSFP